jgi:protein-tyrosine phosphatase
LTAADRTEADRTKEVLFVCTANICRSPMAEAIFDALVSDAGMRYEARSAGVAALVGEPIAPKAVAALEEVGVYPGEHRAKQVIKPMLEGADLVLAMTPKHVATLRRLSGDSSHKIYSLPEYAKGAPSEEGISDPYGLTMSAFRTCVRRLFEDLDRVVNRLER